MSCRPTADIVGAQYICDRNPTREDEGGVYLNVLGESMPECDRRDGSITLDGLRKLDTPPSHCYIYCAQRSCDTAKNYMREHEQELDSLCSSVRYIHGGALEMNREDLVDGDTCHRKIVDHNMKEGGLRDGCLTCGEGDKVGIDVTIDGTPVDATYLKTSEKIPDWYRRAGIVGALPTQFSCDTRYKVPVPHHNGGSNTVEMNISKTGLPADSLLAYWASRSSDRVEVAEKAYAGFENSGIVQCDNSICRFRIDTPGRYTSEGKVYKSHIHLAEWEGDRWNLVAKTVNIE
jgi:hypothetical protein